MSEWKPEMDSIERQADYLVSLKIAERLAKDTIPKTQRKEGKETMSDLIRREDAIEVADAVWTVTGDKNVAKVWDQIKNLPSAQPVAKDINVPCTDTISRQAAIDAIDEYIEKNRRPDFIGNMVWVSGVADAMRIVSELPSVQPNTTCTTTATTTDCISRQAAFEKLTHTKPQVGGDGTKERFMYLQWIADNEAIRELPSVQERKGRWNRVGDIDWECTACGGFSCCNGAYCPNCGAHMEGAE